VQLPEPLTRAELERLWLWESNTVRFHSVAMTVLVLSAAAAYFYSDVPWVRRSVLALVAVLVVAATILQVREKCPRCGSRLRTKLFRLPARCHYCGVAFERPPPTP
jgi:hypothetical protein